MQRARVVVVAVVALLVVSTVAAGAAVVAAYQRGYDAEAGSRAGAEPVLAGVYVALPWVALFAVLALVSLLAGWRLVACSTTRSTR